MMDICDYESRVIAGLEKRGINLCDIHDIFCDDEHTIKWLFDNNVPVKSATNRMHLYLSFEATPAFEKHFPAEERDTFLYRDVCQFYIKPFYGYLLIKWEGSDKYSRFYRGVEIKKILSGWMCRKGDVVKRAKKIKDLIKLLKENDLGVKA